jgi:hypothetical protein
MALGACRGKHIEHRRVGIGEEIGLEEDLADAALILTHDFGRVLP